jgi:hypothetical protein
MGTLGMSLPRLSRRNDWPNKTHGRLQITHADAADLSVMRDVGRGIMSILQNAIDSIIIGIEDFKSPDPRRLDSATRNIFAGILLLFKHKLAFLSPSGSDDALLKESVLPTATTSGGIMWKGHGKKTVDVQRIMERFNALGITVDWKRLQEINDYRNNIEHYYSSLSKKAVTDIVAKSFLVIRDFMVTQLALDPRATLGDEAWHTMVSVNDVYQRERDECTSAIESLDWKSDTLSGALADFKCDGCGSDLIAVSQTGKDRDSREFTCRACGSTWTFEAIVEKAIDQYCGWRNHSAFRDGGSAVTVQCPRCFKETYIVDERQCASCLEELEHMCKLCGTEIPTEELLADTGNCSYCDHIMSKDN